MLRVLTTSGGLVIAALASVAPAACEQSGDTTIKVGFQLATTRVRPTRHKGGSENNFVLVLKPDRSVTERFSSNGPKPFNSSRSHALGAGGFRVISQNSIERVVQADSHVQRMTILVLEKTCSATWDFKLKPGHKEYKLWSTQLGQNAYYSHIAVVGMTCSIE